MKRNTILFLSAIFINMIFLLDVHAQNNNEFYLNYDSDVFTAIKSKYDLDNHIEEYKNKCASIYDEYVVSLYYYSGWNFEKDYYTQDKEYYAYMIDCIDASTVSKFQLRYNSGYYSGLLNYSREDVAFKTFRINDQTKNITDDIVQNSTTESFIGIDSSGSSPYYFFDNLLKGGFYSLTSIPVYSSKDITIDYADNNNGKLYINNEYIENGSKVKFYYNMQPSSILSINDSCTTPGECESSFITITGNKYLSPLYKYKLEIYFDNVLFSTDEYARFINKELPNIYNDTTLKYKLYQAKLSSNDYELVEEKEYIVDLKYDDPEIIFYREQYTDKMLTLHIYFFINDFKKEYTYQYKKNNEEYISSKDAFLVDLEEDSTIIARVLDKNNKVILTKTYTYKLVDPNAPYADYTVNIYDNMMDFMAYVYNINNNYCDYRVNDGSWSDHNVCDVNSMKGYAIYSNTFTEDTKFSIRIFDSNNNLIYTDTFYIKKDEYIIVPENYGSNINKFFEKYSNIIEEFQNLIQYTYDNLSDYIKTFLVSIWTIILVVVTVRLIR